MSQNDELQNAPEYIKKLEKALEAHQLDLIGVLDRLGNAAAHCLQRTIEHIDKGRYYSVSCALYIAKARELTVSGKKDGGFKAWYSRHEIPRSTAYDLVKIGSAVDPAQALATYRIYNRAKVYESIERRTGHRPGSQQLQRLKTMWWQLTIEERVIFLEWVNTETKLGKETKAA
jgi:hypothetical protein